MSVKRRDSKNRVLRNGESQRTDGMRMYTWTEMENKSSYGKVRYESENSAIYYGTFQHRRHHGYLQSCGYGQSEKRDGKSGGCHKIRMKYSGLPFSTAVRTFFWDLS